MATTRLTDRIREDLLTCTICVEEYDSRAHRPLLLPCRHIVCASCVQSLVQGTDINCPVDRKKFRVPNNGLRCYSVDKTTLDIKNFIRRSGTPTSDTIKDKLLKCLKCRSNYDEAEHVPLSLPCQHPLCSSCVESERVHCPIDGKSYMVPQSGFPRDNTLRQLNEILGRISHTQGYSRPVSSQSIATNRPTGIHQRQRAIYRQRPSWEDNIRDFDLEESIIRFDLMDDTPPRGNHMVNVHWQPEYNRRGSPQPFYLPIISNNINQVSLNMAFNMVDVMRDIERGMQAALRGADIAVRQIQRMTQYRE
ncbi:hypothetical protein CHS0354_023326 [Potamilus streckersoni]|uniref:RING-type domain-containing protein n=1 Tax=Potamilus streckersoni TaxID=2493646 RepID=A0AAE0T5S2_9BIVA|nr:hypothetical protein CHS0354_023326 [Potamilus streckersoni]